MTKLQRALLVLLLVTLLAALWGAVRGYGGSVALAPPAVPVDRLLPSEDRSTVAGDLPPVQRLRIDSSLRLEVVDRGGAPVSGCMVQAFDGDKTLSIIRQNRISSFTDERGICEVPQEAIAGENYLLLVRTGYIPKLVRCAGASGAFRAVMDAGACVRVRVIDDRGAPVPGLRLTLACREFSESVDPDLLGNEELVVAALSDEGLVSGGSAVTDSDGWLTLSSLGAGNYTVAFNVNGLPVVADEPLDIETWGAPGQYLVVVHHIYGAVVSFAGQASVSHAWGQGRESCLAVSNNPYSQRAAQNALTSLRRRFPQAITIAGVLKRQDASRMPLYAFTPRAGVCVHDVQLHPLVGIREPETLSFQASEVSATGQLSVRLESKGSDVEGVTALAAVQWGFKNVVFRREVGFGETIEVPAGKVYVLPAGDLPPWLFEAQEVDVVPHEVVVKQISLQQGLYCYPIRVRLAGGERPAFFQVSYKSGVAEGGSSRVMRASVLQTYVGDECRLVLPNDVLDITVFARGHVAARRRIDQAQVQRERVVQIQMDQG